MSDFSSDFITSDEYEYLAIEISFKKQRLCQMFRRKEDDVIELEFVEDRLVFESNVRLKFLLSEFIDVLSRARNDLMGLDLSRMK